MSAMKHEIALFQRGATEKAVQEVVWVNYRPVGQISSGSVIEFNINGTSGFYILLSKSKLHLKVRIIKDDGTPVASTDNVALVNLSLHSLFRQVDVMLNQQIITKSIGVNYAFKAMIDILLNYAHDVKDCQLQSEGYYKDVAFFFDDVTANGGHMQRKSLTEAGVADFESTLHIDVAQQPKAILNGVQTTVRLYQSDDSFRLMSTEGATYRVEIVDAIFKACKVKVKPSVLVAQDEVLLKTPAVYPYWQSDIRTFGIAQGSYTFSVDDMFQGRVPAKLFVGFVSSAAYSGDITKNPFNFKHFYLNYLELAVDGQSVPTVPFQPHYQDNTVAAGQTLPIGYIAEFLSLFKSRYPQAEGNWIQRADYPGGYAIYVFDVKPGTSENLFSTPQKGHTRLSVRFERELQEPVTAIVYGTFPNQFHIDHARNVIL